MKQSRWLMLAGTLFVALVAVEGWPALRDLNSRFEWRAVDADSDGATLDGVQVRVQTQIAAIAAQRPERAAMLVRLELQVEPEALDAWNDCRVSVHGPGGRIWMPLTNAGVDGAIRLLSEDGKNRGLCRLYGIEPAQDVQTLHADQLFLLPSDELQGLRLHVSGAGTRPHALSFALTPEIRQLP